MILLTGATGYIGSHLWIELLKGVIPVLGMDNLSNSSAKTLDVIAAISGKTPAFIEGDIRDVELLEDVFSRNCITSVIHLAGLKDVRESEEKRLEYFDVNVQGFKNLLQVMRAHSCLKIIFSSSAAIYGQYAISPILEEASAAPANYYGETKLEGERLLAQEFNKHPAISSVSLRYFNVAGKHASGLLQDYASSNAHSLFAEIEGVLLGRTSTLSVFGDDWGTSDGTCIRDYLHVSDLAKGHIEALKFLSGIDKCVALNLGLGVGQSVYDVISTYECITGASIPKFVAARRAGDVGVSFADTHLAAELIGWKPRKTLSDMCRDSYQSCAKWLR
jgi:UDP-glucose 4-epimerase